MRAWWSVLALAPALVMADGPRPRPPKPPWKASHPEFLAREGQPPQPRGDGFVLDDSYKDPAMLEGLLRAYHERHPEITALVEIGRSVQDRPIWALKISDAPDTSEDEPAVLFDGAHHGAELITIDYVLDAVDQILTLPRGAKWIAGLEIWCVPIVNPDGVHAWIHESNEFGRHNAHSVDLNRNYPFGWGEYGSSAYPGHKFYRGPSPASEPETQTMMALANDEHFAAVLSFHVYGTDIYPPYLVQTKRDPVPDVARWIASEIADAAPPQPSGRDFAIRDPPQPVAGSAHDWHLYAHGSIAYVVEGSHSDPGREIRKQSIEGIRPLWMAMLDRVHDGPWISGRVRDANGEPVVAEVMIAELQTFEGESWTSRARDGRFDRAVATPGRYTIRVRADEGPPIERVLDVGGRRVEVEVVMPP